MNKQSNKTKIIYKKTITTQMNQEKEKKKWV